MTSYDEYLEKTGRKDTLRAWIDWKTDVCGMTESEAKFASRDPDFGYAPIGDQRTES